jgi:hypothetical protein
VPDGIRVVEVPDVAGVLGLVEQARQLDLRRGAHRALG